MIYAIGSAVRRRVWTELAAGLPIYPNLFLFLVGPPGVGKTQAVSPVAEHLRKSETVRIAPNDMSKQALLDKLADAADMVTYEGARGELPRIEEYHYMAIIVRELSNFMSQYDSALAGILTDLYDNPPVNDESKRGNGDVIVVRPSLSLLAATATKNLGKTVSGDLWGQGFMARVIMVYSADKPKVRFFQKNGIKREEYAPDIIAALSKIGELKGEMFWDEAAENAFNAWMDNGERPVPQNSRLVEYNARRFFHIAKLTMISALSEVRMNITLDDFLRARAWLEHAERDMPEIFKEMIVHSDGETLREMHMHMWSHYSLAKKPIPYSLLASFLMTKIASRDIPRLIEAAEAAGLMERMAGTQGITAVYIPKVVMGEINV